MFQPAEITRHKIAP